MSASLVSWSFETVLYIYPPLWLWWADQLFAVFWKEQGARLADVAGGWKRMGRFVIGAAQLIRCGQVKHDWKRSYVWCRSFLPWSVPHQLNVLTACPSLLAERQVQSCQNHLRDWQTVGISRIMESTSSISWLFLFLPWIPWPWVPSSLTCVMAESELASSIRPCEAARDFPLFQCRRLNARAGGELQEGIRAFASDQSDSGKHSSVYTTWGRRRFSSVRRVGCEGADAFVWCLGYRVRMVVAELNDLVSSAGGRCRKYAVIRRLYCGGLDVARRVRRSGARFGN